ncbi:PPPDE putative thiol peptidase family protein [Actinidia rufa]|uniref:PPPDE putative thiol peptidase family protein n=1 Tax=Actinidia rufa TaxID=165716 RepID=A0A7J0E5W4_9ERIC|nr:PPPDE putative thiol peptidase family protein [Actinidia rufa]
MRVMLQWKWLKTQHLRLRQAKTEIVSASKVAYHSELENHEELMIRQQQPQDEAEAPLRQNSRHDI